MAVQADAEGSQTPLGQIDVVGAGALAKLLTGIAKLDEVFAMRRDGAHHGVRMTDDVFGRRLDRDIHAIFQRLEEQRCRPGVVHHDNGAVGVGDIGDGRDILHLEGLRAGRLREHHPRVRPHQIGDAGTDLGVVVGRFDAVPRQDLVAESAGRPVDAIANQKVIAGLKKAQQRRRYRGQPRRIGKATEPAFQGGHRLLERQSGRMADTAVQHFRLVTVALLRHLVEMRQRRPEDCRGVVNG